MDQAYVVVEKHARMSRGGGETKGEGEEEVAHWQLNSGDLLNSRWHARHGGHKEAANIKLIGR